MLYIEELYTFTYPEREYVHVNDIALVIRCRDNIRGISKSSRFNISYLREKTEKPGSLNSELCDWIIYDTKNTSQRT